MGQHFSRQALYELVWNEPRTALARRLGISDVGLAKACTKAGIPMPARGYWARLAAGKPAAKASLTPRALGQADFVEVGSRDVRLPTGEEAIAMPPEPHFEEPVEAVRARAETLLLRCRVPKGLQDPHRLVAALLDEDRARRKALETDRFAWQKPRFDSPSALRRIRIVNALFMAMAHAGCQASVSSKDLDKIGFRVGDTFLEVAIESSRVTGHARRSPRPVPEERLAVKATGWPRMSSVPSVWTESENGRLEDRILEIARDLLVMGEFAYRAAVHQQYEWSVERRQRLEAEARAERERMEREERERHLRQEAERLEWLLGQATSLRQAEEIRALVHAVDERHRALPGKDRGDTYGSWRSWALEQANLLDPRLRPLAALVTPPGPHDQDDPVGSQA